MDEKFSGRGGKSDLDRFAVGAQALIKGF